MPGTEEFENCMQQEGERTSVVLKGLSQSFQKIADDDMQRQQQLQQMYIQQQSLQQTNRSTTCTTRPIGNGMYRTSCN